MSLYRDMSNAKKCACSFMLITVILRYCFFFNGLLPAMGPCFKVSMAFHALLWESIPSSGKARAAKMQMENVNTRLPSNFQIVTIICVCFILIVSCMNTLKSRKTEEESN